MSQDRKLLIEQVISAWRERDGYGRVVDAPAWHDLDEAGRLEAYQQTLRARQLEAAMDSGGLSSTAQAVLARILRGSG